MSRTDDFAVRTPQPEKAETHSVLDRAVEVGDRLGLTRDAARREMERLRNLSEYEIRKVFGQRSGLREPAEPRPKKSKRQKPATEYRAVKRERQSERPIASQQDRQIASEEDEQPSLLPEEPE